MWIRKWQRDEKKGIDSPIPTQQVSNEEFIPRPQNKKQAQWEKLIMDMSTEKAKKLGMDRRDFLRSSMGMATAFLASNIVYGREYWQVTPAETMEPGAYEDKYPKSQYFIIDVQAHFTNGMDLGFRDNEFMRNMGFTLDRGAEAYSFPNFVKEMYFDSESSLLVISGVPGRESNTRNGAILEGRDRGGGPLPSWLMSKRKKDINDMAGSVRALCQGNCAPNHYWNTSDNKPDFPALFEQMEREVKVYGIDSWKWYGHTDPGRSGNGFRLDDENMTYKFYDKSRELGLKLFSVHKGFSSQSRTLGHFAHPGDIEKAAKDNKDLTFVLYHSGLKNGVNEPEFKEDGFYNPTTGDFLWHADLCKVKERNPEMTNVYAEIGSSFGSLAIVHPEMCMHLIGKNIKHFGSDHVIWGTDCLWWGSPQWAIDAMKRFQITDEVCEKFGYKKVTEEDKANIFGKNAAKVYGLKWDEVRKNLPKDSIEKFKVAYAEQGGQRTNRADGWVRNDVA